MLAGQKKTEVIRFAVGCLCFVIANCIILDVYYRKEEGIMKKASVLALCVLLLALLCSCTVPAEITEMIEKMEKIGKTEESVQPMKTVEYIQNWSFQDNPGTDDYSLFFQMTTEDGTPVAVPADVAIRIENEAGEVVYEGTDRVEEEDFAIFTSQAEGEQLLGEVRLDKAEIQPGQSSSGTVYFTVTGEDFAFDECKYEVLYCLPIAQITVEGEGLPVELTLKAFDGRMTAQIRIDGVEFLPEDSMEDWGTLIVKGEKTAEGSGLGIGFDLVDYKLCDSEGYVVDTGTLYLENLSAGDSFKNDSILLHDLVPGEHYTVRFAASKL